MAAPTIKFNGKRVKVAPLVATVTPAMNEAAIQAVLDAAAVGSTIVLDEGIYPCSLSANKKLLILSKKPGSTWITGKRSGSEVWTDESAAQSTTDLWSCPMAYSPKQILLVNLASGERYHLLDYKSLADLKTRTMPVQTDYNPATRTPGIGPIEGFTVASGKLYIRFLPGYGPANGTMEVHIARSGVTVGLTINASDVTVSGLRFSLQDVANIQVANDMQRPTVLDCYGEGSQVFFRALGSGATAPTNGIIVDYWEFNGGKLYDWRVQGQTKELWDAFYSSNVSSRAIRANTRLIYVGHGYFYNTFDGIEIKGFDSTSEPLLCIVEHCVGNGAGDNFLEFEPWGQNITIVAHHCLFIDGFTYLATAPFGGDRCELRDIICWHSPNAITIHDTDASKQNATLLKTLMHSGIDARVSTQRGYRMKRITFRIDGGAGARLYTVGDTSVNEGAEQSAYDDSEIENLLVEGGAGFVSRLWALQSAPVPSGGTGTPSPAVGTPRPGSGFLLKKSTIRGSGVTASHYQTDGTQYDTRPAVGEVIQTDPQLGSTPTTYFTPANATTISRGDGAVQNGVWDFRGTPGPRWATAATMQQRRAWHANVSKSIVNLA